MYRLLVESLLGVIREGQRLRIRARLPAAWPVCTIHYRFLETVYHITITRDAAAGKPGCTLDGALLGDGWIPLRDDRLEHQVVVLLPPIPPSDASGVQVGADGATL
jgi:cellobiose phosphorylase